MRKLNNKATKTYLGEEEVLEILKEFGLASTKRQLRYILDKGELKYKVVPESNLVRRIKVSEASLYWFIVKRIPAMKYILPDYYAYAEERMKRVFKTTK